MRNVEWLPAFYMRPMLLLGGAVAGTKGRSGGARQGAGRKPSEKTLFQRNFVGPMPRKREKCATEAERAAAKKAREARKYAKKKQQLIEERAVKRASEGREKYERSVRHELVCRCCLNTFHAKLVTAKYCSYECRTQSNNAEARERMAEWRRTKYATDAAFNLRMRIRGLLHKALDRQGGNKSKRTEQILGCSIEYFVKHIELQFLPGMTWENRSEWHIDHIVPVSSARDADEVEKLNHFTNLRPLWAKDNLAKGAKMEVLL